MDFGNKKHTLILQVLHFPPHFLVQILFLHNIETEHITASELLMNTKNPQWVIIWSNIWLMWWIACRPNLLNLSEELHFCPQACHR